MIFVPNLYRSFDDVPASTRIASGKQRAMQRDSDAHDKTDSETLRRVSTEVSRLIAALEPPRHHPWLVRKVKAWAFDVVETKFVELIQQERPCALVILTHYLALFNLLPNAWVYHDLVSHDMKIIVNELGLEWRECIVLPKMALHVNNHQALTKLLLGCLSLLTLFPNLFIRRNTQAPCIRYLHLINSPSLMTKEKKQFSPPDTNGLPPLLASPPCPLGTACTRTGVHTAAQHR